MKTISDKGLKFIQVNEGVGKGSFDGQKFKSYFDKIGNKWTIAWGLTYINGKPVTKDTVLTINEANITFRHHLSSNEKAINDLMIRDSIVLTQNEFDALVDFVYNIGNGHADCDVWKAVKTHDFSKIEQAFLAHNKVGGKYNQGLANRRKKEVALFTQAKYGSY